MKMVQTVEQLEQLLSEPGEAVVESMRRLAGASFCWARPVKSDRRWRACQEGFRHGRGLAPCHSCVPFSDSNEETGCSSTASKPFAAICLDADAVARLCRTRQTSFYLVGLKFGTAQNPAATWATNTLGRRVSASVIPQPHRGAFHRQRISIERNQPRPVRWKPIPLTPLGEYANAAVGRERIFEFYSQRHTTPVALLRLFYATELRYGVLADIARKILAGEPVTLANGCFNCIWQGDAMK